MEGNTKFEEPRRLSKVYLAADVYSMCLNHALTTEKEEVMGLLIGEVSIHAKPSVGITPNYLGRPRNCNLLHNCLQNTASQ